jgi:hypothetical protein
MLPMRPGQIERQTYDYTRHGTTTLFAALEIATGPGHRRLQASPPAHRVSGLPQAGRPGLPLGAATRGLRQLRHPQTRHGQRLAGPQSPHPNCTSSPTSCSWLNLVECLFSILTRQAIRRGIFTSLAELTAAIKGYIDDRNDHPPFTWTKTADERLAKIRQIMTIKHTDDLPDRPQEIHETRPSFFAGSALASLLSHP